MAQWQLARREEATVFVAKLRELLLQWQGQVLDAVEEECGAGLKLVSEYGRLHLGGVEVCETHADESPNAAFEAMQRSCNQRLACARFAQDVQIRRLSGSTLAFDTQQQHRRTVAYHGFLR